MKTFLNDQDKAAIERFTLPAENVGLKPHPSVGDMSHAQWMRQGCLHCDHQSR